MKEFPEVLYKGNSAYLVLEVWQGEEKYIFQSGDMVRIGIKRYVGDKNYILHKDISITREEDAVLIQLSPEETQNMKPCHGIFEIAMQYNDDEDYRTIYQEPIDIKGVVISE